MLTSNFSEFLYIQNFRHTYVWNTTYEHKNLCQNVNHSGESFSSSQTLHNVSQQNTHKQQRNSIITLALWPGVSTDVKLLNECLMLKIQQASKLWYRHWMRYFNNKLSSSYKRQTFSGVVLRRHASFLQYDKLIRDTWHTKNLMDSQLNLPQN